MDKIKKVKKNGKNFDPPPLGFEHRIFEQNSPAQDLNFEGDQINRAHGSKKIWTLPKFMKIAMKKGNFSFSQSFSSSKIS